MAAAVWIHSTYFYVPWPTALLVACKCIPLTEFSPKCPLSIDTYEAEKLFIPARVACMFDIILREFQTSLLRVAAFTQMFLRIPRREAVLRAASAYQFGLAPYLLGMTDLNICPQLHVLGSTFLANITSYI
jgi:hypothetical protein